MKCILSLLLLATICIACTFAAPLYEPAYAQILSYDHQNVGLDGYRFGYESSDGIARQEEAELKNPGTEEEALSIRGSFSWIAPDGQTYTLHYLADENGFQPLGAHLPQF